MSTVDIPKANLNEIPAGKAPPGLTQAQLHSRYSGVAVTSWLSILGTLAVTCWCIRIYVKIRVAKKFGWDDLTCTLGLAGAIAVFACVATASVYGPLGEHMWNISIAKFLSNRFVMTTYVIQVVTSAALGFIKCTIFIFYAQLFWPLNWARWNICVWGSVCAAFYLANTITQFIYITPRPGETFAKHLAGPMAAKVEGLSLPSTSVGLFFDIILLIIPWVAVSQLNMAKDKKLRLIFTFGVGIIAIAGSILTLAFKILTYHKSDLTYHLLMVNLFMGSEMFLGVCIACVPMIAQATKVHHDQLVNMAGSINTSLHHLRSVFSVSTLPSTRKGSDDSLPPHLVHSEEKSIATTKVEVDPRVC